MNYEQTIAKAPGTNPELLKAAIMSVLADIERRLTIIEQGNIPGLSLAIKSVSAAVQELQQHHPKENNHHGS